MVSMKNMGAAAGLFLARAALLAVMAGMGAPLVGSAAAAPDAANGTATGEDTSAEVLGTKSPVRVFLRYKATRKN
jgi:hypothetical protein